MHQGGDQILNITCRDSHQGFFERGDTRPYMTKEQILDLSHNGFEIGLHAVTHSHIPKGLKGVQMALEEAKESYYTLKSWGLEPKATSCGAWPSGPRRCRPRPRPRR